MTSIFRRKGRSTWTVKFRQGGRWRMKSGLSEWQAEQFRKRVELGVFGDDAPLLKDWAARWLNEVRQTRRHGTGLNYTWAFDRHILPMLGGVQLNELSRAHVRALLLDRLKAGLSKRTVSALRIALSACLALAVDDGLITDNVARGITRSLRLKAEPELPRAFDRDEAAAFLQGLEHFPDWRLYFRLLAHTGLRLGEGLALRWDDVDWRAGRLLVRRGWTRGRIEATKTGKERSVDLPPEIRAELRILERTAQAAALAIGKAASYIFPRTDGRPHRQQVPEAIFKRVLRRVGLPGHFTPHSLRHTFARLHLEAGAPLKYVQQQLGHRSIGMTADIYGQWADMGSEAAATRLAEVLRGDSSHHASQKHTKSTN